MTKLSSSVSQTINWRLGDGVFPQDHVAVSPGTKIWIHLSRVLRQGTFAACRSANHSFYGDGCVGREQLFPDLTAPGRGWERERLSFLNILLLQCRQEFPPGSMQTSLEKGWVSRCLPEMVLQPQIWYMQFVPLWRLQRQRQQLWEQITMWENLQNHLIH